MSQAFTPAIAVHVAAAVAALGLGAAVFMNRKGTGQHRWMGRAWAFLMLVVAGSTWWIRGDGHFSWIHGLSVFVLLAVPLAVYLAMRGKVSAHRKIMKNVYIGGLIVAGAFTLLPQRLLGKMLWDALLPAAMARIEPAASAPAEFRAGVEAVR